MRRSVFGVLAFTLTVGIASVAAGHHPPQMERCKSFMFSGQIERIDWRRPHVELFVRTDEGVSHHLTWLAINQLELAGIQRETLRVGDQVIVVAGIRPDDIVQTPMLLSYIHRDSDGWGWSQTPQGC